MRRILARLLFIPVVLATTFASSGTTPFVLDGNRVYARLAFVRPDGSLHQALAFVDMGSPSTILTESLFKELQLDRNQPLTFHVGAMVVRVPAAQVASDPSPPYSVGSDLKVEAVLPAGVMQHYVIVLDYQKRTLIFARRTLKPEGVAVPFHINQKTGLIAVEASINGNTYPITIDNGSAYTWVRQSTARSWLAAHPDWERAIGAVGPSNMMMAGNGWESSGILMRIPEMMIGAVSLKEVGALAAGHGPPVSGKLELFDWYSTKNALPVIGWLGGNVLKRFRLTIDYPHRTMYWFTQSAPDSHDLDQVGLTLQAKHGDYIVAAVATKNSKPTVQNVRRGDKLLRINALETSHANWGAIYAALHGKPGEVRNLLLQRNGTQLKVPAKVTAF